jgi:hypothetical protein
MKVSSSAPASVVYKFKNKLLQATDLFMEYISSHVERYVYSKLLLPGQGEKNQIYWILYFRLDIYILYGYRLLQIMYRRDSQQSYCHENIVDVTRYCRQERYGRHTSYYGQESYSCNRRYESGTANLPRRMEDV